MYAGGAQGAHSAKKGDSHIKKIGIQLTKGNGSRENSNSSSIRGDETEQLRLRTKSPQLSTPKAVP